MLTVILYGDGRPGLWQTRSASWSGRSLKTRSTPTLRSLVCSHNSAAAWLDLLCRPPPAAYIQPGFPQFAYAAVSGPRVRVSRPSILDRLSPTQVFCSLCTAHSSLSRMTTARACCWVRQCLCLAFPLPSWRRQRLCRACPLPSWLRQCLSSRTSSPAAEESRPKPSDRGDAGSACTPLHSHGRQCRRARRVKAAAGFGFHTALPCCRAALQCFHQA